MLLTDVFKNIERAKSGCLGWLEYEPAHQKTEGVIPGQGTYLDVGFKLQSGHE